MNRVVTEDALIAMRVPVGIKGFTYIVDAMEIFEKEGADISITHKLYPSIADRRDTTPSGVEKAVRHAFDVARTKGDDEKVDKYIGNYHSSNTNSLRQLHLMLKREETESDET